jgi:hypothetical protein
MLATGPCIGIRKERSAHLAFFHHVGMLFAEAENNATIVPVYGDENDSHCANVARPPRPPLPDSSYYYRLLDKAMQRLSSNNFEIGIGKPFGSVSPWRSALLLRNQNTPL